MKCVRIVSCFCSFFLSLICSCSTAQPRGQKVSYVELRKLESDNEYLMSELNIALKDLDELRKTSRSFSPRERQFIDSKLEELYQRRVGDARELRDKLERYGSDIGDEKALYDELRW